MITNHNSQSPVEKAMITKIHKQRKKRVSFSYTHLTLLLMMTPTACLVTLKTLPVLPW